LYFIFLSLVEPSFAQKSYKIKGCLDNCKHSLVYLAGINGAETKIIDTSMVTNGCFDFYFNESNLPGMYSIILDTKKNAYIRFLFNNENVIFYSNLAHLLDSMNFSESEENRLYYNYSKFISKNNRKIELLTNLSAQYDHGDMFYKACQEEISSVNYQMVVEPLNIITDNPTTFIAHLLKAQQTIKVPVGINDNQRKEYFKEHYFDNIDFSYTPLTRTDILPMVIRNYLTLFEQRDFTRTEQELSYTEGIDRLLEKFSVNQEMSDFAIRELLNIFRYGDYDVMSAYITEKYMLSNKCENDPAISGYKMTIDNIRRVSVGKTAPEIELKDASGSYKRLSEYTNDYLLVVFWSTTCPYCTRMLSELKELYSNCDDNKFKIIAYSLDTDIKKWNDFLAKENFVWINYNDPKGWQSNAARDYNVSATPMLFLLNKEKKIIAKPSDLIALKEQLGLLGIIK
jgi:peroxiredoxin